jgi:RES domain
MAPKSVLRDSRLIDSLEVLPHAPFKGTVWRVVREDRDPCQCSASGGRWGDGSFDVLYTSLDRDGAIAEMYFQLLRGQPVFPSKVRYTLNEMRVELSETLHLQTLPDQAETGGKTSGKPSDGAGTRQARKKTGH